VTGYATGGYERVSLLPPHHHRRSFSDEKFPQPSLFPKNLRHFTLLPTNHIKLYQITMTENEDLLAKIGQLAGTMVKSAYIQQTSNLYRSNQ
jgi:hypothetical protein